MAFLAVVSVFFLLPGVIYTLANQVKMWRAITAKEQVFAVLTVIGLIAALMAFVGVATFG